jgi:hypothetical protein
MSIKLSTKVIKPHFSVTLKQEQKNLVDYIIDELKGVEIANLKLDPDFLKYIAELIENQVKKNKHGEEGCKPSKMDILVEIDKRLFPHITDIEIEACKGIVEFMLKNTLVKKVPLTKVMSYLLKKRFTMD